MVAESIWSTPCFKYRSRTELWLLWSSWHWTLICSQMPWKLDTALLKHQFHFKTVPTQLLCSVSTSLEMIPCKFPPRCIDLLTDYSPKDPGGSFWITKSAFRSWRNELRKNVLVFFFRIASRARKSFQFRFNLKYFLLENQVLLHLHFLKIGRVLFKKKIRRLWRTSTEYVGILPDRPF